MAVPLRILILEDTPDDLQLMLHALKRDGLTFEYTHVDNQRDFAAALEPLPDLILADYSLPTWSGLGALELIRACGLDVPLIIVSGTVGEETAVAAIRNGAADYLLKDRLTRLGPAVRQAVERRQLAKANRAAVGERRKSEQRFLSLVNTIDGIVFEADAESFQFTFVNQRAEQLLGYPVRQWLEEPDFWARHVHSDDRDVAVDYCQRCTREGRAHEFEYRMIAADGREVWLHDIVSIVRLDDGTAKLRGIMLDVTARRLQDERIARLTRIHALMSDTTSAIMRLRDRTKLLEEACRVAVAHGGFRLAWVGMNDRPAHKVNVIARAGNHAGYMDQGFFSTRGGMPYCCLLTAATLRTADAVVCNDIANDPRMAPWKDEALARGFRSLVMLPLLVDEKPVGVLALYAAETGYFNPDEVKLLAELAGDISFGLQYIEREEQASHLAYYDPLTKLTNRAMFQERLEQFEQAAGREGGQFAVVMIDVDRFKVINDTYGRQAGDRLIQQVAERLERCVGERNQLARIGAIRFGLVLPQIRHADDAARLVEHNVTPRLTEPFLVQNTELRISMKAGIAVYPQDGKDAETLFQNAEAALKKAKASGEPYLFFAQPMAEMVAEKLGLENELRAALENDEFVLYYQPEVELATGRTNALEALIRWQSPARGLVSPGLFIPLLEETGLITEVGEWALNRAVKDCRAWRDQGITVPRVAVNVSVRQFRQKDFVAGARKAARNAGRGISIDLEITESMIMENVEQHVANLRALQKAGLGLVIDDFGTGYSSLSYIARLPIRALKIDRSFVHEMGDAVHSRMIVSTIIKLAHSLNLRVIGEGVETERQLGLLRDMDCDDAQGYLFSKPMPPDKVARLLEASEAVKAPLRRARRKARR
jgi:diguanylate cyclase (GGDEF)-like protein/PAS domain S-box-containing protein